MLLPRYSGGVRFLVLPPAGYFLCGQKVTKEPVREGGFRFPPSLTTLPLETTKRGGLRAPSFGFLPRLLNYTAPVLRPYSVTDEALGTAHFVRPGPDPPAPPLNRLNTNPSCSGWQSERRHVDQPRQRNCLQVLQGGYPPEGPMAEVLRAEAKTAGNSQRICRPRNPHRRPPTPGPGPQAR